MNNILFEKLQLKEFDKTKLCLNVIHNRFDLLYDNYDLYLLDKYQVPVHVSDETIYVGLYLNHIDFDKLFGFWCFLFNQYPKAQSISMKHSLTPIPFAEPYPYWHVNFPKTIEEFDATLHSKVRYNTKWYPKKIREDLGEYEIKKYPIQKITSEMVVLFLKWKEQTHHFIFEESPLEYVKRAGITHAYILTIKQQIEAVGFICDTGENVYFENFSYNTQYAKYSLGMVLYHFIISDLITLQKKTFYLSGGHLDYKRRYNGIESTTYSCLIYRDIDKYFEGLRLIQKYKKWHLPYFILKKLMKHWGKRNLNPQYLHFLLKQIKC